MSSKLSPIAAATLQAACLSALSNFLAQCLEAHQRKSSWFHADKKHGFDIVQLLRFVTLTLITAPPNYHWQQFLERKFPAYPLPPQSQRSEDVEKWGHYKEDVKGDRWYASQSKLRSKLNMRNTLTKWFIDCITAGTIMNTLAFLIIMGILKGQGWAHICQNLKLQTFRIIFTGYKIWPIASIISFSFIPVHRRIVFLSFIGLMWGIYMSLVASNM